MSFNKKIHTDQKFGSYQVTGDSTGGKVEFKLFFPVGFQTGIQEIRVVGDFQQHMGKKNWDFADGISLTKSSILEGEVWSCQTSKLPAGFYQYKYIVRFSDGSSRWVSDPYTRYSGDDHQNAAIVVGGSQPNDNKVDAISQRLPLRDLVVYEMNIDDFTAGFRGCRAPLDAVHDKLGYLKELGINAILFMPWTAWKHQDYDWGYEPFHFFAVEYRLAHDPVRPTEKISWLKKLINACHKMGIHVIMDGVFNHVSMMFPYKDMYEYEEACPYTGKFGGEFPGLRDLNYNHTCTQDFIRDVCLYWIDEFKIDGIRFDNTTNFHIPFNTRGIVQLMAEIDQHTRANGIDNFSMTLEHLDVSAISVVRGTKATSYWDNALYGTCFDHLWHYKLPVNSLNTLNNNRYMNDFNKVPTLYLGNHDHSHVNWQAGARDNLGGMRWFRTQPWAIALFTAPGSIMIQNGQEFSEDHWMPEDDQGSGRRVLPRPLRWKLLGDQYMDGQSAKHKEYGKKVFQLYQKLIGIRFRYPALRSNYFYPDFWETWQIRLNTEGYGIDTERQIMIFRREGQKADGTDQKFIIVLNFNMDAMEIDVPFPHAGPWHELMEGTYHSYISGWTRLRVGGNWGHIYLDNP